MAADGGGAQGVHAAGDPQDATAGKEREWQ